MLTEVDRRQNRTDRMGIEVICGIINMNVKVASDDAAAKERQCLRENGKWFRKVGHEGGRGRC